LGSPTCADQLCVGTLTLCPAQHRAWVGTEPVNFTRLEFSLLHALVRAHGRILSKEYLLETVWGFHGELPDTHRIKVCLWSLRRKLGAEAWRLQTVREVGVRFEQP
jgi:two-component system alkaline phosphatase synthesis response regulator PhoP